MHNRPFFVFGIFLVLFWLPPSVRAQIEDPVRVQGGLLSGVAGTDPSVSVYKGIPFAAPPVGGLRWRPPQPPHAWEGVREADTFSDGCIQNLARSRPPWTEEFMHQGGVSEDCLYLNVWTTADAVGEERPVLVYIHGGGFNEGSGSVALYDGEALARKGLVVVTINYRLGVLGFLAHPELTGESPHGASGNYGLLDQVAALRWVQENIAAFGGNPDNVTIAGQSAGAMSVYLLTASPLAEGLFDRAIIQSGPGALASFGVVSAANLAGDLSDAEETGVQFAESKGAESLAALRALSVAELTAPGEGGPFRFRTVVDGYFLPDGVSAILYAVGRHHDVPILTGMNADEASAFPGYGQMSADAFREQARERYGDRADAFLELYPAASDDEAGASQVASMRDLSLTALSRLTAEWAETSEAPAYVYYFARGIPWPEYPHFGAFHTAEVPYVFDNLEMLDRPWEPADRQLADVMSSYWVNFATTGDPNGEGLPAWPAFSENPEAVMVLGEDIGPRVAPDADERAFFEAYLAGS